MTGYYVSYRFLLRILCIYITPVSIVLEGAVTTIKEQAERGYYYGR